LILGLRASLKEASHAQQEENYSRRTKVKINKGYIAAGMIIAFTLFFELAAHADEADQATEITFNQPIHVPGQTLPAGTYLFKLANADDLNMVQIFSPDRTHLYASLQTIPTDSRPVPEDTTVALVEQGAGKPDVLLKWFYPGEETGHEFVYSNRLQKQMANDKQQLVVANQQPIIDSEAAGSH
jgi:hypothetical protein